MPVLTCVPNSDPSQGREYKDVDSAKISFVEIFPAVGIARVGDSTKEFFFGPELPLHHREALFPTGDHKFRDSDKKIRRQAARFRAYAYDDQGKILGEVNKKNGYELMWTVHVANTKAAQYKFYSRGTIPGAKRNATVQGDKPPHGRSDLIVDPGEKGIDSGNANAVELNGTFKGSGSNRIPVNIGQLQVDETGRLVFIAARGSSRSVSASDPDSDPGSIFDNDDWVDDVCDGWVSVTIKKNGREKSARNKATVVTAPPKFVWGVHCFTSVFDIIENIYHQGSVEPPDFYTHIWPVLFIACSMSWVHKAAYDKHGPYANYGNFLRDEEKLKSKDSNQELKKRIFEKLRNPDGTGNGTMPPVGGDNDYRGATLTKLQYERFKKWQDHDFVVSPKPGLEKAIEDVEPRNQPKYLTLASLEATIGEGNYPGIDTDWIVKEKETYLPDAHKLDPPYRVNYPKVRPGDLTGGLAIPWQTDFKACGEAWWPAGRPGYVFRTRDDQVDWTRNIDSKMVKNWRILGFVRKASINDIEYLEAETG